MLIAQRALKKLYSMKMKPGHSNVTHIGAMDSLREQVATAEPHLALSDYQHADVLIESLPDTQYWVHYKLNMKSVKLSIRRNGMTPSEYLSAVKSEALDWNAQRSDLLPSLPQDTEHVPGVNQFGHCKKSDKQRKLKKQSWKNRKSRSCDNRRGNRRVGSKNSVTTLKMRIPS